MFHEVLLSWRDGVLIVLRFLVVVVIVISLVVMIGVWAGWQYLRSRRLSRRAALDLEVLIDGFGVSGEDERRFVGDMLACLGRQLDVAPGVLRPTDRFDRELRLARAWIGFPDVSLEAFFDEVRGLMARRGLVEWPGFDPRGKCLWDLVAVASDGLHSASSALAQDLFPAKPTTSPSNEPGGQISSGGDASGE